MDIALANTIVHTATHMASTRTADAVNIAVLKKALDMQKTSASTMLDALAQSLPQPPLATSGPLGTQLNTWA